MINMTYLDAPHIKELLVSHKLIVLPGDITQDLARSLNLLPWLVSGTRLDWERFSTSSSEYSFNTRSDDLRTWVKKVKAGKYPCLVALYSPSEGIYGKIDDVLDNFDIIFWKAPGPRYLFGAKVEDGTVSPDVEAVLEYDGSDCLIGGR